MMGDESRRPPTYDEALALFRSGREALSDAALAPAFSTQRHDALTEATALFAGAQAAAALRLVAPVNVIAGR